MDEQLLSQGRQAAFAEYNRRFRIDNFKVGCLLVTALMPAGFFLDLIVYPEKAGFFFFLRMVSAVLAMVLWVLLRTALGKKYFLVLGMICFLLPAFFISVMIYFADGVQSSYYAGLNLALIGMTWAAQVEFVESIIASVLTVALYCAACYAEGPVPASLLFNHLYFITLTGVIVVTGSYSVNRLRFREFALREQLEEALEQIKETESQLVHQAKMASLGQLSAGLMHEINNPLNFANTAFHLLKKRLNSVAPDAETLAKPLADIQDGIKRVVAITSSLRDFTHPDTSSFEPVNLAEVVASAVRFVPLGRQEIAVKVELPAALPAWGNANQLVHLFINLLQNAMDSLLEKGAPGKEIRIEGREAGAMAEIDFWDNGKGIAPEHLSRIYDAFFTTKKVGSGVGLGLNTCYRIVEQHQGRISVDSRANEYCHFSLALPRSKPAS